MSGAPSRSQPANPSVLRVEGLTAWYDPQRVVLDRVALDIPERSVVGLLGANGAGKTTLINCLSGVHDGLRVDRVSGRAGFSRLSDPVFVGGRYAVFTESHGFQSWTFDKYVGFLERVYRIRLDPGVVQELASRFHFDPYRAARLSSLSTGNRKKAFLIAGLALRLPLLILDEPTDALDFEGTEYLYEAISAYRAHGSVFMSSHVAESFERCCDSVCVLKGGSLSEPHPVDDAAAIRGLVGLE
ncbi:MAG: ATP-binding cassette domain-containing protein [Propionibacteriaceae bacterium]|jgi:ABC-2 type transport system ATP-binding protein|nr:ATP-binding cassette domain-containing protein [Propionibacteriaceae bacterium]